MAAELDKLAEYFAAKGDEDLALRARELGSVARERGYLEIENVKEVRSRLIAEAFSTVPVLPKVGLSVQLAESINLKVGQYLEDEIPTNDLTLSSGQDIDPGILRAYNSAMKVLQYRGYPTVGKVREADLRSMRAVRKDRPDVIHFAKIAFARPQAGK